MINADVTRREIPHQYCIPCQGLVGFLLRSSKRLLVPRGSSTRRSHERFSRRKWGPSWRYRRSVDSTTATNDGLPKREPEPTRLRVGYPCRFEICLLPCTSAHRRISFTRLEQAANRLRLRFLWRKDIRHGSHRIFGKDNYCLLATLISGAAFFDAMNEARNFVWEIRIKLTPLQTRRSIIGSFLRAEVRPEDSEGGIR